jgi:class 3 adenylate cyclase/predicted ATPase
MQQIADWLKKVGLGQYAQRFADNDIDASILRDLTDQDLERIGVQSLGHRRKLLRAIADLKDVEKSTPAVAIATVADAVPYPLDSAERRQVTVMFSDLVGSTELAARMDPEDLRDVISAYQQCVSGTVHRYDGFVAKYMGDGVLVYFGYPQAHEDDADRAVRAGLELIAAVTALKSRASLQSRVGIATGLVVVGDLIGSGDAQERGIVGETPNLAARLQGIAPPNMVVIADGTRRLLGNLFELQDLGPTDLKGIAGPVRAWGALRARSVESRFEALHTTGLIALVGREEESELLLRRWSRAKAGEGQVVLLSGEAGIGKSRLTAALLESLATEPHTRLRYFCSPQHTDSALYPIIGQMERAAGLAHDDKLQARLYKLDAVLAQTSASTQDAALFAEMLSLPNDGRYPALELTPQQRRQKTLEALISQLEALTRSNPVLMIFEDAHWTDPTSLEVFGRVVDGIAILPVLLIVTFRPEFDPPWIGQPHVTALTINRLTQRDVGAMIDRVVGNKLLPASIRRDIVERTDGIPLFVEEMTKAVLEAESEGAARRMVAAVPSPALAVPASLHASLMARLDRIGPAKEVAEIGAAIGREFSHALLASVARKPEAELELAIGRLIQAGLLFRRGAPPNAQYTFKHALVQDVAYASLLRANRQQLHARIARAYESRFPEVVRAQPELVAHHFTEAGLSDAAIEYWQLAGDLAMARSGHAEAIHHFSVGLDLLTKLGEKPDRAAKELELCLKLGPALMMVKGTGSPEVEAIYSRAVALEAGEDSSTRFKALWGLYYHSMTSGHLHAAAAHADELLGLAQRLGADDLVLEGHHAKWSTSFWCGHLAAADEHSQKGISRYDCTRHHALAFTFSGHDPGVCAHDIRAATMALSGFPQKAVKLAAEAVTLARSLSHPYSLAIAMWSSAIVLQVGRQRQSCRDLATELLELSQEHDFPMMRGAGMFFSGWATADGGEPEQGIALMEQGLALFSAVRHVTRPYMLAVLASANADLGKPGEGLELLKDAFAATEISGERWWQAELHRLRGRLLVARGQHDKSEACFRSAIEVSSEQRARTLELRAATSLARLWSDQGRHAEARDLLTPIYGWFTEGFDTLDLKEAKILLDELGP